MQTTILVLHIIICLVLIVLILLQAGKEGLGVMFGGSGNTSVFGSAGAGGILLKLTSFLGFLFIVTSLTYNLSTDADKEKSVLDVQFEEVMPIPVQEIPAMIESIPDITNTTGANNTDTMNTN